MTYEECCEIFASIGEIPQKVYNYLKSTIGQDKDQIDGEIIRHNIQENKGAIKYYIKDGMPCRSREDASYIWVSTGLASKNGHIYVVFCRQGDNFIAYSGRCVQFRCTNPCSKKDGRGT